MRTKVLSCVLGTAAGLAAQIAAPNRVQRPRAGWALASALAGMVCMLGACDPDDDNTVLVRISSVTPDSVQVLDLSTATAGQMLLRVQVRMSARWQPDDEAVECPPQPADGNDSRTFVVYPGALDSPAHLPGRPDQRITLQGLELVAEGDGWTCGGDPFEFRYRLRVTDPALLPQQPTGDLELSMSPELCEYYTPRSGRRFTGVPAAGSAGCDRYTVTVRLRITSVPAGAAGTLLQLQVQGPGRVLSTPSGIACGADCAQEFPPGTEVTLTAVPDAYARFVGFFGDTGCTTGRISLGGSPLRCTAEFVDAGGERAWQAVGGSLNVGPAPSEATGPAVVLTAGNLPWVAWGENGLLQVKRWDGNAWQLMGELSVLARVFDAPVMALDADGRPWVAWQEDAAGTGQSEVYVKRWDGANWQVAVLPAPTGLSRSMPHLALHQGRMRLTWVERRNAVEQSVLVYGWDGSAWQRDGGSALRIEELAVPRIASDGDELRVAFVAANARVQVVRLLTALQFLQEETSFDEFVSATPAMSFVHSPRDGWLLALQPTGAQGRIFQVRRWANGAWSTLGGVHGRTEPGGLVTGLALVNGAADQPLLAWAERSGGAHRILVRRWESGAWVDQGGEVSAVGRSGPGLEGPLALADGLRPTLAFSVRSSLVSGGQLATDVSIQAVELR